MRIVSVIGTRPEAIKMAPLVESLARRRWCDHQLVVTGQHPTMLHETLAAFHISPDVDLAVPNPGLDPFCRALAPALGRTFEQLGPDLVMVQGDTSSAWIGARVAHGLGIPVGHVEAGLRSGNPNLPWPEERNRREIDALSTLLFAPSPMALANLRGHVGEAHLTGNTGIDALLTMRDRLRPTLHDSARRQILVTCHRREAIPHLPALADMMIELAARPDVELVLPLHPNPAVRTMLEGRLARHPRIRLEQPLGYPILVGLLATAHLLLTDSGGLQEEAPALGLPTLVLREETERPEPVAFGAARLVGLSPARILAAAHDLLDHPERHARMSRPVFPYGRGDAAERIADILADWATHPLDHDNRRHMLGDDLLFH